MDQRTSMRRIAIAVAATALLSGGVTAQQATTSSHQSKSQSSVVQPHSSDSPAPKLAKSHDSKKTSAASAFPDDAQNQLVKTYCVTCHSERGKAGGLSLVSFDAAQIEHN